MLSFVLLQDLAAGAAASIVPADVQGESVSYLDLALKGGWVMVPYCHYFNNSCLYLR
jgi:hypothetical protein